MPTGEYLVGVAFLALVLGGSIAAGELLVRRRMAALGGATRLVAVAILATAVLLAAHLVPGALTILSRESAALCVLVIAVAAWFVPAVPAVPAARGFEDRGPAAAPGAAASTAPPTPSTAVARLADRALAALAIAAGSIWLALVALRQLYEEPLGFDAASAYMPTAARWLQEGSIWGLGDWLPNFFFGASPGNGSVVVLAWMLPFDNDFLARYAIFPFVALMAFAVYALARELGARWPAAAVIALMVSAAPVVVQPALNDALLDPVLYAAFAAGLLFLVRHSRTAAGPDLVLAGISLGIAFGTKFYGFTAVPIVIAVWVAARLISSTPARTVLRQAAGVVGLVALFGGIWVLRNAIATGNPIFPVGLEIFGTTIFSAPEDPMRPLVGSTLVSYLDQPGVWLGELRSQFRIATGLPLLLIAASAAAALALTLGRARRRALAWTDAVAGALLAAAALLLVSYAMTPYSALGPEGEPILASANVRYGMPAMIAAAGLAGYVAAQLARWRPWALTGFVVAGVGLFFDALRIGVTAPRSTLYISFAAGALVVAIWLAGRAVWPRARVPRPPTAALVAAAAAALLALVAIGGQSWQRTYNASRYVTADPALNHVVVNAPPGSTVGLAGTWDAQGVAPIYPAFGQRLENEVVYIGRDEDGLLQPHAERAGFIETIEREAPDLLVIGRAQSPVGEQQVAGEPGEREREWARGAGYRDVIESERLLVLSRRAG